MISRYVPYRDDWSSIPQQRLTIDHTGGEPATACLVPFARSDLACV
jgi:hypothetical protein